MSINAQEITNQQNNQINELINQYVNIQYESIVNKIQFNRTNKEISYTYKTFIPGISRIRDPYTHIKVITKILKKLKKEKYEAYYMKTSNTIHVKWDLGYNRKEFNEYISSIIFKIIEQIKISSSSNMYNNSISYYISSYYRYDRSVIMNHVASYFIQKKFNVKMFPESYRIYIEWTNDIAKSMNELMSDQ